jgi:hypothetical protein
MRRTQLLLPVHATYNMLWSDLFLFKNKYTATLEIIQRVLISWFLQWCWICIHNSFFFQFTDSEVYLVRQNFTGIWGVNICDRAWAKIKFWNVSRNVTLSLKNISLFLMYLACTRGFLLCLFQINYFFLFWEKTEHRILSRKIWRNWSFRLLGVVKRKG